MRAGRLTGLHAAALLCHGLLLVAVAALAAVLAAGLPWRVLAGAAVSVPLLLTLPGLINADRRGWQRLAVLLVAYAGGATVEVVANAGSSRLASIALLASVGELGALLALIRRSQGGSPAARG